MMLAGCIVLIVSASTRAEDQRPFIPADADWGFDAGRVTERDVRMWNDNAARHSYSDREQFLAMDNGLCLRFKNRANRPRLDPAGYIRAKRDRAETEDTETIDAAHQWLYHCDDRKIERLSYNQEYEVGFRFMVPAPHDADMEAFEPEFIWIWSLPTSPDPTGGAYGISLGGRRVDLIHRYVSNGSRHRLHRHNLLPRWRPNVWYSARMRFVAGNKQEKSGWIDAKINGGDESAEVTLRNIVSGKDADDSLYHVLGQYSAYRLGGFRRTVYFDQWYLKKVSGGT
ncbi:MAG: hypothetical protein IPM60_08940 [Rhodospirillales bacterium]|nr:hypothetical protein [Rhodospirillales bacterium]